MRYYEDMNAAASAYTYFLPGVIQTASNICIMVWKYTIPKRATPAISFSGQTDFQADYAAATADSTAMTADMTGVQSTRLYATITGTPASNPAFMLRANNKTTAFIAATAEL
jgi:anaerobic glycerol-3-phosphate dehydrogenase